MAEHEALFARLDTAVKNGQTKRGLKAADDSELRGGVQRRMAQLAITAHHRYP
jgi:hypothetical protein